MTVTPLPPGGSAPGTPLVAPPDTAPSLPFLVAPLPPSFTVPLSGLPMAPTSAGGSGLVPTPVGPGDTPASRGRDGGKVVRGGDESTGPAVARLVAFLDEHPGEDVLVEWRVLRAAR
jgi:hypothetical protein